MTTALAKRRNVSGMESVTNADNIIWNRNARDLFTVKGRKRDWGSCSANKVRLVEWGE